MISNGAKRRGRPPRLPPGFNKNMPGLTTQRLDEVSHFNQIIEHENKEKMEALALYHVTNKYYFHRDNL